MSDLVERLRGYRPQNEWGDGVEHTICNEAADEIERLRTGIKRLSDEEELCAETTGDDPFSLVYLAAKLAAVEAETKRLRATLDESQDMHLSALRRNCTLRDALVKISSPTQTEGLLWWQTEARAALGTSDTKENSDA